MELIRGGPEVEIITNTMIMGAPGKNRVSTCYELDRPDWLTSHEVGEVTRSLASAYMLHPLRLYKVLLISGWGVRGRGTWMLLTDS